jgi:hypothetical protein
LIALDCRLLAGNAPSSAVGLHRFERTPSLGDGAVAMRAGRVVASGEAKVASQVAWQRKSRKSLQLN